MKKIILSYDYELFFGYKSGTVLHSIIEPTNLLLDYMDKYNLKGNFFVDYLMFKYLSLQDDEICKSDLCLLENQVKSIVKRGHRIELHLHPHWIDAEYNGDGTWNFSDFTHYSLSSLNSTTINSMFIEGVNYLENLVKEVDEGYKVYAFRAGGWAVQPFDKLKEGFENSGIKVDSSVAPKIAGIEEGSFYDFRNAPLKDYYRFTNDVCQEENDGVFLEVPISTYKRNIIYKIIDKILRLFTSQLDPITDGTHIRTKINKKRKNKKLKSVASMITMSKVSPLTVLFSVVFKKIIL